MDTTSMRPAGKPRMWLIVLAGIGMSFAAALFFLTLVLLLVGPIAFSSLGFGMGF